MSLLFPNANFKFVVFYMGGSFSKVNMELDGSELQCSVTKKAILSIWILIQLSTPGISWWDYWKITLDNFQIYLPLAYSQPISIFKLEQTHMLFHRVNKNKVWCLHIKYQQKSKQLTGKIQEKRQEERETWATSKNLN